MAVFDAYAKYYDLIYKDKDYRAEADYIIGLIKKYKPDTRNILNLGCGTGKHDIYFAKDGYEIIGVEQSDKMLEMAGKSLQDLSELKLNLRFVKGDIRNIELPEKFDVITSLFHVINYQILNKDLRAALKTVKNHLQQDGKYICDLWYGPAVLNERPECRVKKMEDSEYRIERHAVPELLINENRVNVNYSISIKNIKSGETEKIQETHKMRYLFLPEIELLLEEIGLKIEYSEEWITGEKLSDTSWYALLVIGNK